MNRLLNIGFKCIGHWLLEGGKIKANLQSNINDRNVLYAFISDGEVQDIGKTIQSLFKRMDGYRNPGNSQTTNIKNNRNIIKILKSGGVIDIFALPDNGLMKYGDFHLNLAAGLEDSLISIINPPWNNAGLNDPVKKNGIEENIHEEENYPIIRVPLNKTYYNKGFFNVSVENSEMFGADREAIEIFIDETLTIHGYINRTANSNGTPRIMCGAEFKNWVQKNCTEGQFIEFEILSTNYLRVTVANQALNSDG